MILIRYFLICLIGYLLIRSFVKFGQGEKSVNNDKVPQKKVSKEIGDYIDYEEIKKLKK